MSAEMDDLKVAVTENTTVAGSVVTYIEGLAAQILDAAGDKAASTALAAEVRASASAMSAAMVANTPAVPTP